MAGLYLHIPYCVRKCAYCDFVSAPDDGSLSAYVDALVGEIRLVAAAGFAERTFDTVFFGGGTPSLLSGAQVGRVMDALSTHFTIAPGAECSMESNPGTVTAEKLAGYRAVGINRLSIGLESANDALLKKIGRIHTYRQFLDTVDMARRAGFTNLNADVMHGLPGQTERDYLDTLRAVTDLALPHVSSYALILNEHTPLYDAVRRGEAALPDPDAVADMEDAGIDRLGSLGYVRYEISNFAKPGMECRHNVNYWNNGEYLGLGVAAHSAVRTREWTRYANTEDRGEYIRLVGRGKRPVAELHRLHAADEMFETVMLGLRMTAGVDRAAFCERFGVDMADAYPDAMEQLRAKGWVLETEARIALNRKGLDLENRALQLFMEG